MIRRSDLYFFFLSFLRKCSVYGTGVKMVVCLIYQVPILKLARKFCFFNLIRLISGADKKVWAPHILTGQLTE